jgi:hypothetical protein
MADDTWQELTEANGRSKSATAGNQDLIVVFQIL